MSAIYTEIGFNYDITRRADPHIVDKFAQLVEIKSSKKYLDVACGTGNYTIALSKYGGEWFGFDQSEKMLNEAKLKANTITWSCFDVAKLDYDDEKFDGAICSLAIHHFPNLSLALIEIARVLKPNSKLVIFTSTPEQMQNYWLTEYFPEMMEKSCKQMPSILSIKNSSAASTLRIVAIEPFFIEPNLKDFFLYSGKFRPSIYLSQNVRDGISSFKNFCSKSELESGLANLEADIESGTINAIPRNDNLGDYMFITLKKQSNRI